MNNNEFTPRKISGQDFDLLEYRPGKFVKIVDGECIEKVRIDEYFNLRVSKSMGSIDPGVIEVAIALSAITALFTSSDLPFFVRLIGFCAFLMSSIGAGILYWYYIIQKVPWANFELDNLRQENIYFHWIRISMRILKIQKGLTYREQLEFAYVTILGAFAVAWIGAICWILYSFSKIQ